MLYLFSNVWGALFYLIIMEDYIEGFVGILKKFNALLVLKV